MSRKLLLGVLIAIVLADLAQPALLPWRPKFYGALAGALIYGTCAAGVVRGWRWPLWVVAAMPLVPTTVIGLYALGVEVPRPDAAMLAIFVLQLAAAGLAVSHARSADPP